MKTIKLSEMSQQEKKDILRMYGMERSKIATEQSKIYCPDCGEEIWDVPKPGAEVLYKCWNCNKRFDYYADANGNIIDRQEDKEASMERSKISVQDMKHLTPRSTSIININHPEWGTFGVMDDHGEYYDIQGDAGGRILSKDEAGKEWKVVDRTASVKTAEMTNEEQEYINETYGIQITPELNDIYWTDSQPINETIVDNIVDYLEKQGYDVVNFFTSALDQTKEELEQEGKQYYAWIEWEDKIDKAASLKTASKQPEDIHFDDVFDLAQAQKAVQGAYDEIAGNKDYEGETGKYTYIVETLTSEYSGINGAHYFLQELDVEHNEDDEFIWETAEEIGERLADEANEKITIKTKPGFENWTLFCGYPEFGGGLSIMLLVETSDILEGEDKSASLKTAKWKVEMRMVGGWDDPEWTIDDKPMVFDSKVEAQKEIDELIAETKEAVELGHMDEAYSEDDFRIVPIKTQEASLKTAMETSEDSNDIMTCPNCGKPTRITTTTAYYPHEGVSYSWLVPGKQHCEFCKHPLIDADYQEEFVHEASLKTAHVSEGYVVIPGKTKDEENPYAGEEVEWHMFDKDVGRGEDVDEVEMTWVDEALQQDDKARQWLVDNEDGVLDLIYDDIELAQENEEEFGDLDVEGKTDKMEFNSRTAGIFNYVERDTYRKIAGADVGTVWFVYTDEQGRRFIAKKNGKNKGQTPQNMVR